MTDDSVQMIDYKVQMTENRSQRLSIADSESRVQTVKKKKVRGWEGKNRSLEIKKLRR